MHPSSGESINTAAEIRQAALAALMPRWIRWRESVATAQYEFNEAKGDLKAHKECLAECEADMQHVGECHLDQCLTCLAIGSTLAVTPPTAAANLIAAQRAAEHLRHDWDLNSVTSADGSRTVHVSERETAHE